MYKKIFQENPRRKQNLKIQVFLSVEMKF